MKCIKENSKDTHVFKRKEKIGFEKHVLKDLCLLDNYELPCCGLKFEMLVFVTRFVGRSQVLRDLGFLLVFRCFPGCTVLMLVCFSTRVSIW